MPAKDPLSLFHPAVAAWFRASLGEPTKPQAHGWPSIVHGESTLILAPTGSGKTLAAFLAALDRLLWSPEPDKAGRCKVLYVSPLKALAVDIERNLRAPLVGIAELARREGAPARDVTALVRTGDTPQIERARMQRTPPDILITTPESLYLVLTSNARKILASVDTVIIDEIHSLVPTKRGAHLFLSLERLEELRPAGSRPLQRIGLSATQRPLDEVARLLGGFSGGTAKSRAKPRPVTIIDASEKKKLDVVIEVPAVDMAKMGEQEDIPTGPAAGSGSRRSIWPYLHERIVPLVRAHRSTMIFVNSRRLAERLAAALNELAGSELALAHHGSVAREKRAIIEDRLKRGDLPAIVATSSMELGVDMGAVDLVIQIEAPPSVASGLQRIGRAGHTVGGVSRGIIFPKHRGDLLACAAAASSMRAGQVEETFYPRNALDVLAQQIVAIASVVSDEEPLSRRGSQEGGKTGRFVGLKKRATPSPLTADSLYALVRRAAPFAELPRGAFDGVLDMLSGRYPSDDFAGLRARITWDRTTGRIRAREGAARLAIVNGGTIPDRGLYGVFLMDGDAKGKGGRHAGNAAWSTPGRRVGELDEEMVFELREGEVFLLGASSWKAEQITHDRVLVSPAAGEPGKMPFWHGDRPGRPLAFGMAIGKLARELAHEADDKAEARLRDAHGLDASAAANLRAYLAEQVAATGDVPSDRTVVLERFVDELGDWRVCVLTPFGARVHAPWATAIMHRLKDERLGDVDTVWSDDGMAFRVPASSEPPPAEWFFPASGEIEGIVTEALDQTSLFAAHFRESAARALLLPRRRPGERTPLWAQRKRSADLLAVASQHPSFPILLETYRECLRDVFDLPGLVDILRRVESRRIRVTTVDARSPSPFAASLLFSFVANFIYDGDAPLAERRAQALSIDHAQLRELLGEAELRSLLDPDAIEEHIANLQRLTYPVKHADGLHDLLLMIGDLSRAEIDARATPADAAGAWLRELVTARRVFEMTIAGEARYGAAEDAGRFRDALGIVAPRGTPKAFLEPSVDPMGDLLGRYARTHGPFVARDVIQRFGLSKATADLALERLVDKGKLVQGAFLASRAPGAGAAELSRDAEYCDAEVLRALRRKSLAKLRRAVEPVDDAAYARLQLAWQLQARRGPDALIDAIRQLEGCPLHASALEREILPARVQGFRPWDLDALCASGEVVWAGVEPLGSSDGRIALFLAEHESLLTRAPGRAEGALAPSIRELLMRRGAVFFAEIAREVGGFSGEVVSALWDMVWAGEVTNDTLEPLRSYLGASRPREHERSRRNLRPRAGRGGAPGTEGRWSLRASRWGARPGDASKDGARSDTEHRTAVARTLLDRYGVVTREVAHAEGLPGGFSAVYEVFKAMEEAGRIRRGYFVAGRGATQFALPGADDRLRSLRAPSEEPRTRVLAATDPANPYGAALPWPGAPAGAPAADDKASTASARPQRASGALVILADGVLVGYLGRGGQSLVTFLPAEEPQRGKLATALAESLAALVEVGRRRAVLIASIDGGPPARSALAEALTRAGFTHGARGWLRRASTSTPTSTSNGTVRSEAKYSDVHEDGQRPPAVTSTPTATPTATWTDDDNDEDGQDDAEERAS